MSRSPSSAPGSGSEPIVPSVGLDVLRALDTNDPEQLESTLERIQRQLRESRYQWVKTNVHLINLNEVSKLIVSAGNVRETVATVSNFLARSLDFDALFVGLVDREREVLLGRVSARMEPEERVVEIPLDEERAGVIQALRRGTSETAGRDHSDSLFGSEVESSLPPSLRMPAFVTLPILKRPRTLRCRDQIHCGESDCPRYEFAVGEEPCYRTPDVTCRHVRFHREKTGLRRCVHCSVFPALGVVAVKPGREGPGSELETLALETFLNQIGMLIENAELYRDLRQAERFRAATLDSMSSGLITVDRHQRVTSLNVRAGQMLGVSPEEAIGTPISRIWRSAGKPGEDAQNPLTRTLSTGKEVPGQEVRIRRPDGKPLILSVSTSHLRDGAGRPIGVVAELKDTSTIRKMEEEIWQLEKLAAIGRLTTSVAHEIRNPLAGIGTGIQYLARSIPEDDPHRETINFILNEIMRLDRIIVDLYSVSRPSSLLREQIDPAVVVDRALRSVADLATARNLSVEVRVEDGLPAVSMDADKIQQVLINLIKNAYEASSPGGRVRVEVKGMDHFRAHGSGEDARPSHVWISVEDEGEGIPETDKDKIFEPFFSRKEGGTGLGLYVSYSIVERHGGDIAVESTPGVGTRITVELPVDAARAEGVA